MSEAKMFVLLERQSGKRQNGQKLLQYWLSVKLNTLCTVKSFVYQLKIHAHDESNQYGIGDVVVIEESRPLSKPSLGLSKNWLRKHVLFDLNTVMQFNKKRSLAAKLICV